MYIWIVYPNNSRESKGLSQQNVLFIRTNFKALCETDLLKIWDEVFCDEAVPIEYAEMLDSLRSKYFLKQ